MASCLIQIYFLLSQCPIWRTLYPRSQSCIGNCVSLRRVLNVSCTASRRSALTQAPSAYTKSTFVHNIANRKHMWWRIIWAYIKWKYRFIKYKFENHSTYILEKSELFLVEKVWPQYYPNCSGLLRRRKYGGGGRWHTISLFLLSPPSYYIALDLCLSPRLRESQLNSSALKCAEGKSRSTFLSCGAVALHGAWLRLAVLSVLHAPVEHCRI